MGVSANSMPETDLEVSQGHKVELHDRCVDERCSVRHRAYRHNPSLRRTSLIGTPEIKDVQIVLAAANKCVGHFTAMLDHGVEHEVLDRAVRRTLAELDSRVHVPL